MSMSASSVYSAMDAEALVSHYFSCRASDLYELLSFANCNNHFYLCYLRKNYSRNNATEKYKQYTQDVSGKDMSFSPDCRALFASLPDCHFGYDKTMRPVIYNCLGSYDIDRALRTFSIDAMVDIFEWQCYAICVLLFDISLRQKRTLNGATLIIDLSGVPETIGSELIELLRRRSEVVSKRYPYLFHNLFVINAAAASAVTKPLLDLVSPLSTGGNIHVYSVNETRNLLNEMVSVDCLPSEYNQRRTKSSLRSLTHPYSHAIAMIDHFQHSSDPYRNIPEPPWPLIYLPTHSMTTCMTTDDCLQPNRSNSDSHSFRTYSSASSRYFYSRTLSSTRDTSKPFSASLSQYLFAPQLSMSTCSRQALSALGEVYFGNNYYISSANQLTTGFITSPKHSLSLAAETILQSSVGFGRLLLRTVDGVMIVEPLEDTGRVSYRKICGDFHVVDGCIYRVTRGAALSGWLQKWPMRSQASGGSTRRYFVLKDDMMKYWKAEGEAASNEEPRGSLRLTSATTIKRSRTFFGSSYLEIDNEEDTLQICADTQQEENAWYNEIILAVQNIRYKENSFHDEEIEELSWRQEDTSCCAVATDVARAEPVPTRSFDVSVAGEASSLLSMPARRLISYVVLCCVHTGISAIHSVQIGIDEHCVLRLENNDLDSGIRLTGVRMTGDQLLFCGSKGFIGAGRIPDKLLSPSIQLRRMHVRRLQGSRHGDDAALTVLATARSADLVASGDDLGCLCLWRRDGSKDVRGSSSVGRATLGWECIYHVSLGHKITFVSFSADARYMSVCTPEKCVLFNVSSATEGKVHMMVSLDDATGFRSHDIHFAVDLTAAQHLQLWKLVIGAEARFGADDVLASSAVDGALFDRFQCVQVPYEYIASRTVTTSSYSAFFVRLLDILPESDVASQQAEHCHSAPVSPVKKSASSTMSPDAPRRSSCGKNDAGESLRLRLRSWWGDLSRRFLIVDEAVGEDVRSTFYSEISDALGRRIVSKYSCRGMISTDASTELHYVLSLIRDLHTSLQTEYICALLAAWRTLAIDAMRRVLEFRAAWFRDMDVITEVLRRLVLAPDLGTSGISDAISHLQISLLSPENDYMVSGSSLMPPVTANATHEFLEQLRDCTCLISDEFGSISAAPAAVDKYLQGDLDAVEEVDELLQLFVIVPLCHIERCEPFAVALAVDGMCELPSCFCTTFESSERDSNKLISNNAYHSKISESEVGIGRIISQITANTPQWVRFILNHAPPQD